LTRALVDTEVWSLAKKRPVRSRFGSEAEYERALKMHVACRKFFEEEFDKVRVYMSLHQVAEIFHVLSFKGSRLPTEKALKIVTEIFRDSKIVKVPVSAEHVKESVRASKETGIHVWDFLCFVPVKNYVSVVYSLDVHFLKICEMYGKELVNPAEEWLGL